MRIAIECDCGNNMDISVQSKKYIQFRDGLESQYFQYDGEDVRDGKLKEFRIKCVKCKSWFTLGVD